MVKALLTDGDGVVIRPHKYFDGAYFSGFVGFTKEDLKFFEFVLEDLGLKRSEVVFVDDDEKNVGVARKLGIKAEVYKGVEQVKKSI